MTRTQMGSVERVLRYGISGGTMALVFSLSVVAMVHMAPALGAVGASVVAFFVAQPFAYVMHRLVTYPDAGAQPGEARTRRVRFVITNLGGFIVATGGMAVVTGVLHGSYLWGIALNWVCIPGINFLIYLYWVFNVRPLSRRSIE